MAARARKSAKSNPRQPRSKDSSAKRKRLKDISSATSQIVQDAAALLDEEIAVGIVTAKKMQDRFQSERRIDPRDFQGALSRLQGNAHEVVNLLSEQLTALRTQENAKVVSRVVNHTHSLLDLVVQFVDIGAEITSELLQQAFSAKSRGRRRR